MKCEKDTTSMELSGTAGGTPTRSRTTRFVPAAPMPERVDRQAGSVRTVARLSCLLTTVSVERRSLKGKRARERGRVAREVVALL